MAGQGAPLGAERLFQQDVLHSVGSHCLVENDGCTEMTTDQRGAEIARLRKMLDDVREETVRLNKATDKQYAQTLEKLKAERDAALAQVARLHHLITEASDPDFIWGAMDNVNDMGTTLDDFAKAASRAIRAAIPILAAVEKEASP